MGDYDWALIDWLNFLTAGNVFLPKTFVRMITNWRVRVQSTSSEFIYSQTLRESEQNSMDLGEIKFVWYQSNPHSLLFMESSFVCGLLFVFVSVLFSETNKMDWYQFNPQILGTPSRSHFLAVVLCLGNKQSRKMVPLRNLSISTFWW